MTDYMKFVNSTPYTIKLLADAPEQFEGKFGLQNNYKTEVNGKEMIVSQKIGSGLDLYLEGGKTGDVFLVEKRQDPQNPKNFPFHVEKGERDATAKAPIPQHVSKPQEPMWDMINAVKTWHIDKSVAFKEACVMADETGEVESLFLALFPILRNDGALIVSRIQNCTSLAQLETLWKAEGALYVELVGLEVMGAIQKIKAKKADSFPKPKVEEPPPPPEATPGYDDSEPLPF